MITVGMNYHVLEGKEERFEQVFRAVLETMRGIEGHGDSRLYRDVFDPRQYVILSEWTDREAFEAFIASETFRKVADWGKESILAGRPSHQYYEPEAP